ncbi:MAG: hypothetical protein ABI234_13855 [Ktedonobacteraceae bacterium]
MKEFPTEDKEKIHRLADVLRERYPLLFQSVLEGKETSLLKSIASHLDISERNIIAALISYETEKILASVHAQNDLRALMDIVARMPHSP